MREILLFALVCLALLPPVQAQLVPRTSATPSGRRIAAPARPGSSLTPGEQRRLAEVMSRMTPKERKRLAKAVKHMTPEQRKKLVAILRQPSTKKGTAR